ncbi:membrane protein FxsA [Amylibacter marinus]|uniref:Membrane protein FxsA n=1 Tax=Amylibacter marinus TaxID=1475483 RepID=A0ABQ5VWF1_9RHOB|nr:membrane protein FxsA [Amylibacter marinus]
MSEKMWLFIIFVAIPIIEIGLFIQVGGAIGLWPTLATVIITAFVGTQLLRAQGIAALGRLQQSVGQGQNPMGPIAHGALILVAGVVLLTPGFFTDAVGLALLIPPVRAALIRIGAAKIAGKVNINVNQPNPTQPHGDVVDADFSVLDPEDPPSAPSGWTNNPINKQ